MTQLEAARRRRVTEAMRRTAHDEGIPVARLMRDIAAGHTVIPYNNSRALKHPCAIGKGLRTKINANIGTSPDKSDAARELRKLDIAVKYGADTVMDLSVGTGLALTRKAVIARSPVPVGTVPVYEMAVRAQEANDDFLTFTAADMMSVLERQAAEGVDFFTIHAGVTRKSVRDLARKKRVMGIVSRGGAMLAAWMRRHKRENPFFEHFDWILDIAYRYDVTLSLGDGLRPGSVLDATDPGQVSELRILGDLCRRARARNVQVMIEGPGHVPYADIVKNIALQKRICKGAPFYVLGPLVTDTAPGYDHITGAIGGTVAAAAGADYLCYVTPAEHLRHPSEQDVREGVIASRIAAHAADIAKGVKGALAKDAAISRARASRDWKRQIELSLDPDKAREYRLSSKPQEDDVCTMCGKFCSIKVSRECGK